MRTRTPVCLTTALVAIGLCCGCVTIGIGTVSEGEALAAQITGLRAPLSAELAEYESVRGVDQDGKVKEPPEQTRSIQRLIAAQQRRQFNSDDVQTFLKEGVAGENNQGLLTLRPTARSRQDAGYTAFVQEIIRQENADRHALMVRVIEMNEGYHEKDLSKIQAVFAQQNRDVADTGVWIQEPEKESDGKTVPGEWTRKSK